MGKTVLFLGDSITDGNRSKLKENAWDLNHQIGHSYVYMINGRLGRDYPEKDLHFVNRGISGDRLIDLYARLEEDVIEIKPDILSILVGINDCIRHKAFNIEYDAGKFDRIYRMLLDEVRHKVPGIRLVLCEPFVFNVNMDQAQYQRYKAVISALQPIIERIAQDYHARYVPLQASFEALFKLREASYWIWDGIHPTESGHQVIADEWIKAAGDLVLA